ncbi:hypothetical protein CFC21_004740 [Triticum aestivum]|uniref:Uncharacterized protein n=2 Tax=Triticum aestivum TaxID=4565 RepID=A0A3B5YRB1_WHEAT|nr:hypothetical protein CFC21_004740 [Triticum aestivum]
MDVKIISTTRCTHQIKPSQAFSMDLVVREAMAKMGELLTEEKSLPAGVREDVEFLSRELTHMQRQVGPPVGGDELFRVLADENMALANRIEKVVDAFVQVRGVDGNRDVAAGFKGLVEKTTNFFNKGKVKRQVATEMKELKGEVEEAIARRKRYDMINVVGVVAPTAAIDPRLLAQYKDHREIVGIQETRDELITMLSPGSCPEDDVDVSPRSEQLKIFSITGFGGLGKTTLAKAVYDRLKAQYDCTAFVSVGLNPDVIKVFRDILFSLDNKKYMGLDATVLDQKQELVDQLRGILDNRRFLIVVDDIWDWESWDDISRPLVGSSSSSNGSAVVMTSRRGDVARRVGGVHTKLAPLTTGYSTRLFRQTAFGGSGEHYPPELADISDEIIRNCSGMPLAIITMASSLRGTPLRDWHAVHESNYFDHSWSKDMRAILAMSYTNLPPLVRLCLLYLSMFGKGCEVSVDRLLWGWIAEGFLDNPGLDGSDGGIMSTWRERGELYLDELVNSGLVEPVDVGTGGRAVSCRVHSNIVHDLIVSLSASENYAAILDGRKKSSSTNSSSGLPDTSLVKRLSIQIQGQWGNNSGWLPPRVRLTDVTSLVVSGDDAACVPSLSEFHDLRALDLDIGGCADVQNDHLKGIAGLSRLRLRVLDLRATSSINELPVGIARAAELKCLRVHSHTKIPDGMLARMTGLEELGDINISKPGLLRELHSLKKLTILGVALWSWDESCDDALLGCSLHFLHALGEKWEPPQLRNLVISHSALVMLPPWIPSLEDNLSSLSIENLLVLCLTSDHAPKPNGRFTTRGFRNLISFNFASNAMGKVFEPGAMLKLTRLKLSFEASLTRDLSPGFHFGLENLPSLEHARVRIICFSASLQQVKDAEDAISKAICTANLQIQRVHEQYMAEDNDEEEGKEPLQVAYFRSANDWVIASEPGIYMLR